MTDHPIAPPPLELVHQWVDRLSSRSDQAVFTMAAQWGADQELDACCEWIPKNTPWDEDNLRAARRPQPLSQKKQAMLVLHDLPNIDCAHYNIILRALEQLDD